MLVLEHLNNPDTAHLRALVNTELRRNSVWKRYLREGVSLERKKNKTSKQEALDCICEAHDNNNNYVLNIAPFNMKMIKSDQIDCR